MARKPDNKALLSTYYKVKSPSFSKPRFGEDSFIVKHFAGDVEYMVEDFIEKNNDALSDELLMLLKGSNKSFVKTIMSDPDPEGSDSDSDSDEEESSDGLSALPKPPDNFRKKSVMRRRTTGNPGRNTSKAMAALNTVSFVFRSQLDMLTQTLEKTTPHYIKCIKPNSVKAAGGFSR